MAESRHYRLKASSIIPKLYEPLLRKDKKDKNSRRLSVMLRNNPTKSTSEIKSNSKRVQQVVDPNSIRRHLKVSDAELMESYKQGGNADQIGARLSIPLTGEWTSVRLKRWGIKLEYKSLKVKRKVLPNVQFKKAFKEFFREGVSMEKNAQNAAIQLKITPATVLKRWKILELVKFEQKPLTVKELIEAHGKGLSLTEAAEALHRHYDTISKAWSKLGLHPLKDGRRRSNPQPQQSN